MIGSASWVLWLERVSRLHARSEGPLTGRLTLPGDKSISHRALLFNALGVGEARITGLLAARDVEATAGCLRALGATIERDGDAWKVIGCGGTFARPSTVLDCGNSGTSMRLLTGILASQPFSCVLDGDAHLRKRPMARVADPLTAMGATLKTTDGTAPLHIQGGNLEAGRFDSAIASAQVKSALVLATLGARLGTLCFTEPHRSRDHTERMLGAMGIDIAWKDDVLVVKSGQVPRCRDVQVPADISSAAFFLVAATIVPGSEVVLEGVGVNPTRTGILEALGAMGADIQRENEREVSGEPLADLRVRSASLKGIRIDGALVPRLIDEIPVLAVAAACAAGETVIADARELRVKESDRIASTVAGLTGMGVDVREEPDGMRIHGGSLAGATVDSRGDHRIAMAFAVAGRAATGETVVEDAENVATSFPEFEATLEEALHG